jgi:endonuclease YncB( thermonuclease family)
VEEQAEYFRGNTAEILAAGTQAGEFTRRLLLEPFTVETCWIDAKGSSRRQRFFGKITLADGSDLGLPLVEAGLARRYGMRQGLQNSYLAKLDRAESAAKAARRGVWGGMSAGLLREPKKRLCVMRGEPKQF